MTVQHMLKPMKKWGKSLALNKMWIDIEDVKIVWTIYVYGKKKIKKNNRNIKTHYGNNKEEISEHNKL